MKVPDTMAGKKGKCPKCHGSIPLSDILPAPASQLEVFSESPADPAPAPAEAATSQEWYYSADGQEFGPVSLKELEALIEQGRLKSEHFLWKEGMAEWAAVSSVPELGASVVDRPAEPPAAPQERAADPLSSLAAATEAPSEAPVPPAAADVPVAPAPAPIRAAAPAPASAGGRPAISSAGLSGFGDAFSGYIEAAEQLFKHPIRLVLVTIVYMLLSYLAFHSVVGIILFPVFVMGYVTSVMGTVRGDTPPLADFIAFMRHGWDSLWHLMMLLAAFFVTVATVLAPVVLLVLALYVLLSTVGILSGSSGLADLLNSPDRAVHRLLSETSAGDGTVSFLVSQLILAAVIVIVATPLAAGMILCFSLAMDVASTPPPADKFNLVYDAFKRMFAVATRHWALLLSCGVLISSGLVLAVAAPMLLSYGMAKAELMRLAAWCVMVLLPVLALAYLLHANAFAALTSAKIRAKFTAE
ncbi:MAG: DUF4339 domain-containing protein [Planctomycetaceae bacterium]|nr:DUF4339 domain-containing protein [Planctomycetaceae bacterium]